MYGTQTPKRLKPVWFHEDLIFLLNLLKQGKIKPIVAARMPLNQAAQAHYLLQQQPHCGVRSYTVHLQPGSAMSVSNPGCGAGFVFKAANSGKVIATIIFSYTKGNSIGTIPSNSGTKSFQINICP